VRDLVARGCNPLGFDGGGFTALHCAAQGGHTSTLAWLLEWARAPPEAFVARLPAVAALQTAQRGAASEAALAARDAAWLAYEAGTGPAPGEGGAGGGDAGAEMAVAELAAMVRVLS
jgi:hypothetical protein